MYLIQNVEFAKSQWLFCIIIKERDIDFVGKLVQNIKKRNRSSGVGKGEHTMKNNKYEIDMCNGSIMDKLISFALPLMLSGILQLMFNAVDIVVVGRFSGSQSLAAVGSTTALINVFTNLFIGISLGTNVLAARFYGAGKTKKCQKRFIRLLHWHWSAVWQWQ